MKKTLLFCLLLSALSFALVYRAAEDCELVEIRPTNNKLDVYVKYGPTGLRIGFSDMPAMNL